LSEIEFTLSVSDIWLDLATANLRISNPFGEFWHERSVDLTLSHSYLQERYYNFSLSRICIGLKSLIFLLKEMLTLFIVALNTDVVSSLIYHERDMAVLSPSYGQKASALKIETPPQSRRSPFPGKFPAPLSVPDSLLVQIIRAPLRVHRRRVLPKIYLRVRFSIAFIFQFIRSDCYSNVRSMIRTCHTMPP